MNRRRRILPSLVKLGKRVTARIFSTPVPEEVDEEFAFHVEMRIRELLRKGRTLEEARTEAVERFGDMDEVKAACRRVAWERERKMTTRTWWEDLGQDVRLAFRQIRRNPGFALVAILTLALGIGANTAVFSVVHGVVLRPLPFDDPDELVTVWTRYLPASGFEIPQFPISPPELLDYRGQNRAMEDVGYYTIGSRTLTGDEGDAVRLDVAFVDDRVFPILGVEPHLGRWVLAEEDVPTAGVVVLGWDLWAGRFGADSTIVNRTVTLNGNRYQVAGVMPEGFFFPSEEIDLWENFGLDEASPGSRGSHFIVGLGRLAEGTRLEQARAEVESIHAGWAEEFSHNRAHFPILNRLEEDVVGTEVRRALFLVLAAVGLVLLVACVNVANLALARAEARTREVSVRTALGAGRGRMVRQFLTESLVLGGMGGLLGVLLSAPLARAVVSASPNALPRAAEVDLSLPVLGFTALVTLGTVFVFGAVPAFRAGSGSLASLSGGETRTTSSRGRRRFRRALVGIEAALSVLVLVGAGLVLRSYDALTGVDPGIEPAGVLTFQLSLPSAAYPEMGEVTAFYDLLSERLASLPGVTGVGAASQLPLTGDPSRQDFVIEGKEPPGEGELAWNAERIYVRRGYFRTMGIGLLKGRTFGEEDGPEGPSTAVVNRELARLYFPGEEPLGRRVGFRVTADSTVWLRIVGVVESTRGASLDEQPLPQLYNLQEQMPAAFGFVPRFMNVTVATSASPASLVPRVRAALAELDPNLAMARARTMVDVLDRSTAQPRLTRNLLAAFGLLALVLAAVGIYGVVSYSVARRTREIGIRMALGAGRGRVSGLMVREGTTPALLGAVLGVAGALALGGWVQDLLFQVGPGDPVTLVSIPLLLVGVALLASWMPARRAGRVAPTEALREE